MSAISTTRPIERRTSWSWRRGALIGAAAIVVVGAGVLATHSPLFHARTIQVTGTSQLQDTRVLEIAGISSQTNVAYFDTTAAEHRLEADPWVARASIERHLPSRLAVDVVERVPVAAFDQGRKATLLAGDGTALAEIRGDPGLPLVQQEATGHLRRAWSPPGIAARAMAPMAAWVRAEITRVVMLDDGSLELHLGSGARIDYGEVTDTSVKARSLAALLRWADVEGERILEADLRAPTAPTARLGSGTSGG